MVCLVRRPRRSCVCLFDDLVETARVVAFHRKNASDEEFARTPLVKFVGRGRPTTHLCKAQSIDVRLDPLVKPHEIGKPKGRWPDRVGANQPQAGSILVVLVDDSWNDIRCGHDENDTGVRVSIRRLVTTEAIMVPLR
jgi:hypothetical protein